MGLKKGRSIGGGDFRPGVQDRSGWGNIRGLEMRTGSKFLGMKVEKGTPWGGGGDQGDGGSKLRKSIHKKRKGRRVSARTEKRSP